MWKAHNADVLMFRSLSLNKWTRLCLACCDIVFCVTTNKSFLSIWFNGNKSFLSQNTNYYLLWDNHFTRFCLTDGVLNIHSGRSGSSKHCDVIIAVFLPSTVIIWPLEIKYSWEMVKSIKKRSLRDKDFDFAFCGYIGWNLCLLKSDKK